MTRLVCVSDTHGRKPAIPDGDVLVHAGDSTMLGTSSEVRSFARWLATLPHRKVIIAGNHDWLFQREPQLARRILEDAGATYLCDQAATVAGLKFYGAPWQPEFCHWAFNLPRGNALAEKWAAIPEGLDVLVTHGPPASVLDRCPDGQRVGCGELRVRLERVKPRLHVFGHIHDSYGRLDVDGTTFVNAAICDERYSPVNAPVVIDV